MSPPLNDTVAIPSLADLGVFHDDHLEVRRHRFDRRPYEVEHPTDSKPVALIGALELTVNVAFRREVHLRGLIQEEKPGHGRPRSVNH